MPEVYYQTNADEIVRVDETLTRLTAKSTSALAYTGTRDISTGDLYTVEGTTDLVKYDSTLTEQWRDTSFVSYPTSYIGFFDGALYLTSDEPGYLAKFDTSGAKQWTTASNGYHDFTYDGSYIYATLGDGTYDKIDPSDGTKVTNITTDSGSAWIRFRYGPSGNAYVASEDNGELAKISDIEVGTEAWNTSFTDFYGGELYLDSDENLYLADTDVYKVDSSGNIVWQVNVDGGKYGHYRGTQPHPDGSVYTFSGNDNTYYRLNQSDGSVAKSASPDTGDSIYGAIVYQRYDANPGAWSTTVTKSASATQVASSSAQRTASGAITDSASATTLASSATPQTPSGTSTADVTATEATSSTTQQTPGATGFASSTATETASTATTPTVSADRGLLANATQLGASATMESPVGTKSRTVVASDVVASGGLTTPSITTVSWPDLGAFRVARDQDSNTLYEYSRDLSLTNVGSFSSGFGGVPIDEDGARYIEDQGLLTKYDQTGTELWQADLTSRTDDGVSAISITESYVYVGLEFDNNYHTIYELDKSDGSITNSYETSIIASTIDLVAPTDRAVYVETGDSSVISVDVVNRTTEWTTSISGRGLSAYPDGTPYTIDTNDNTLTSFDPTTGSTSTYGQSFGSGVTVLDVRFTVDGEPIISTSTSSGDRIGRYTTGGATIWESPEYTQIRDFQIDPRGGAFISYYDGSSYNLAKVDDGGNQIHSTTNNIPSLGYFPSAATFPALWSPDQTASVSLSKTSSDSTLRSPTSTGIATPSPTPATSSTTMSGPVGTGSASAGATAVASSSTLFAPAANGQAGASSTQISASSVPNTSTGTRVASSTATPYPSSASMSVVVRGNIVTATATSLDAATAMLVPSIGHLRVDVGTNASASTTMQLPTVDVEATASGSTYEAVADPRVPLIGLYATAQKYGAQGETNQAISFAPRTTALEGDGPTISFTGRGSGANDVEIEPNRNDRDGE